MKRPYRLLTAAHVDTVRQVLTKHPGVSLRKLCPFVMKACGLASMNENTLHRFIDRHGLPRTWPDGTKHQLAAEAQSRLGLDLARLWPTVIVNQEHAA